MRFLLDEHAPNVLAEFLADRGHEVYFARERVPAGAHDRLIVAAANQLGAIVITWNFKHFRRLITRDNPQTLREFPDAGLISVICRSQRAVLLFEKWIRRIEIDYELRQTDDDRRVIVEIRETALIIR
jgi:hypothetical protein